MGADRDGMSKRQGRGSLPSETSGAGDASASGALAAVVADTRGAIFLLGIGLGLVLLGVAWNVSSVGAAALWRERATDVADAAAFDAAVWHARGMNLLVVSNLLMAVFMALFSFWRMLATVLAGLSYLCNWPVFPSCSSVQPLAGQAASLDDRVAENLSVLGRSLASTERAIASLAPVVPLARTPATLLERYPEARAVQTFSQALLPSRSSLGASSLASGGGLADGNAARSLERRLGIGVSLPVEAGAPALLCARSVEADAWLTRRFLPFDIETFGPGWQAMTGGDPGFFCESDTFPPQLRQAVQEGLLVTCAGNDEPASCVRRRLARFQPTPLARGPGAGSLSTAKLWEPFDNGGPFASVWAVAELPRTLLAANDRGLVMPDAPGRSSLRALSDTGHVASQAEFYFDCTGSWAECRDDAAWRLWYRARLRPLRAQMSPSAQGLPSDWAAALQAVVQRFGGEPWRRATEMLGRAATTGADGPVGK
ncbi:MAG TPA: hypothetical protein VMG12_35020 [Polyangiaceae bacterium]|nr:hypothetical protein [Polyangiaceae bacterium]